MFNIVKDHYRDIGAFLPRLSSGTIFCADAKPNNNIGGMYHDHNWLDRGHPLVRCRPRSGLCGLHAYPPPQGKNDQRKIEDAEQEALRIVNEAIKSSENKREKHSLKQKKRF